MHFHFKENGYIIKQPLFVFGRVEKSVKLELTDEYYE